LPPASIAPPVTPRPPAPGAPPASSELAVEKQVRRRFVSEETMAGHCENDHICPLITGIRPDETLDGQRSDPGEEIDTTDHPSIVCAREGHGRHSTADGATG